MLDPTKTAGGILSKQTIIDWIAIWPRCQEHHLHSHAKGLCTLATTTAWDLSFSREFPEKRTH